MASTVQPGAAANSTAENSIGKFCILGAGSSGLAVAKTFLTRGIEFECVEREDDVGGNWYFGTSASSVYRSTRLISSKSLTQYTDFPMPAHYPDQPDQEMVWRYLRSYAEHFGLYPHIQFNTCIDRVEPHMSGGWNVTFADGRRRCYAGVVVANGHNWDPRWPCYPGTFVGPKMHSSDYKTPEVLAGRRVLVVGGGNSGFDIATESARHASATFHSLRRGYALLPRYHRGKPVDEGGEWMLRWRMPLWLRRMAIARACRRPWVPLEPPPVDHAFFQTHPSINGRWPIDVRRGAIVVKPDVAELQDGTVQFVDGSREQVDVIIYATGFKISLPFVDPESLGWSEGRPELFLNVFHPTRDELFFVGLIQPDSGQFGLVDYQSQLVADYILGLRNKRRGALHLQKSKRHGRQRSNGIQYVESPRHLLEVEHYRYLKELCRWIARLRKR